MTISLFRKLKRGQIRSTIRGFDYLSKNNNLHLINKIYLDIFKTFLKNNLMSCFKDVPNESIIRYFMIRFGTPRLTSSLIRGILQPNKRVVCVVPPLWIDVIESHGIKVNRFLSRLYFFMESIMYMAHGIRVYINVILEGFCSKSKVESKVNAHLVRLVPNNLPKSRKENQTKNIFNWFKNNYDNKIDKKFSFSITEPIINYPSFLKNIIIKNDIYPLSFQEKLKFFIEGLGLIFVGIIDLINKNKVVPIMLSELLLMKKAKLKPSSSLAQEYLFHNTTWVYRPLWTYAAEQKGAKITLYFYSTNNECPIIDNDLPPIFHPYKVMKWPNYLVWNEAQADFVKRCDKSEPLVKIVGPIYFSDNLEKKFVVQKRAICVFDVSPVRKSIMASLGFPFDYYCFLVSKDFLQIISDVAQKNNFIILFKQKRFNPNLDKGYTSLLEKLNHNKSFKVINSDINAYHLIKDSKAVISMPFTSTHLIAQELDIPSIYFDPTNRIKQRSYKKFKDEGLVLHTYTELDKWMKTI